MKKGNVVAHNYQPLFDIMREEHGVILTISEMDDIISKVDEVKKLFANTDKQLTTDYLMELHPELNKEEAEDLKQYASSLTIRLKECYGDGSIIYPKWKNKTDNCSCDFGVIECPGCSGEKESEFGKCAGCEGTGIRTCGKCGGLDKLNNCPKCKQAFTKEELNLKEHCFNCGWEFPK